MEWEKSLRFKTVAQLKEECTAKSLSTSGTKAELIKRIKEYMKAIAEAEAKAEADAAEEMEAEESEPEENGKTTEEAAVKTEEEAVETEEEKKEEKKDEKKDETDETETKMEEEEEEAEIVQEDIVLSDLTDVEIEEFIVDKAAEKKLVTCKLCLDSFPKDDDDDSLTKHLEAEEHMTRFQEYKEKTKGQSLLEVYAFCEFCEREIAYPEWEYHQDTDRHTLNKLLVDNGAEPIKVMYAVIQKQIDEMNTLEKPVIGLFFIQEIIEAKSFEEYKIRYCCRCCGIEEDPGKTEEEIIEHVLSTTHIEKAVELHFKEAYDTCTNTVNIFNRSKPKSAKSRNISDEISHYILDNGKEFFRRHKMKTKIRLSEEHIKANKEKYGKATPPHPILTNTKVELEPDVKAKIQDEIDDSHRPMAGLHLISERQYLNGDLEYYCVLCHEDLKEDVQTHSCGWVHKKKLLLRLSEPTKKINEIAKWQQGLSAEEVKSRDKKVRELVITLAREHLDKFPRPQLQVALKAGKSMPALFERNQNIRVGKKSENRKRKMGPPFDVPNKKRADTTTTSSSRGGTRGSPRGGPRGGRGFQANRGNYGRMSGYNSGGRYGGYGGGNMGYGGGNMGYGGGNMGYGGNNMGSGGNMGGFNNRSGYQQGRWQNNQGGMSGGMGNDNYDDMEAAMVNRISTALARQMAAAKRSGMGMGNRYGSGNYSGNRGGYY